MTSIQAAPFRSLDPGVFAMDDANQNFPLQFQCQYIHPAQMMMLTGQEPPLPLSADPVVDALAGKQAQELDCYVQQQNNLLRRSIQRRAKQQMVSLVQSLESKAAVAMKRKEEEVAMAESRALQLEAWVKRLQQERDAWESAARESEAMATSLRGALEQLRSPCLSSTGKGGEEREEDVEVTSSSATEVKSSSGSCRVCGAGASCMLLLPCRHVCCCKLCDAGVGVCPVCLSAKEGSVEVFFA